METCKINDDSSLEVNLIKNHEKLLFTYSDPSFVCREKNALEQSLVYAFKKINNLKKIKGDIVGR